jgi:hypothetical protein
MAMPRYQVPDDRQVFDTLDVPEMQRSYVSPVATMSLSGGFNPGMSRSTSLPAIQKKTVSRLTEPKAAINKLECDQFNYFVPKAFTREGKEKLMSTNLSKLQKQNRITMPFGDGTGFRTQSPNVDWMPTGASSDWTSYRSQFQKPPHFRISPHANDAIAPSGSPPQL